MDFAQIFVEAAYCDHLQMIQCCINPDHGLNPKGLSSECSPSSSYEANFIVLKSHHFLSMNLVILPKGNRSGPMLKIY